MTLDDLTVNFDHLKQATLLEDWQWLIGNRKFPIMLTSFGDAFLEDADDGTIHMLDVGANEIYPIASSANEFEKLLSVREFVGDKFKVQIVGDLRLTGLILKPGQIYSFVKPPHLGGSYELDNLEATDISVHFSLFGQIGGQVRNLPPGTKITGITITDAPKQKSRWKFWQ